MSRNGVRGERSRNVYQPHRLNLERFRVSRGRENYRIVYNVLDIIYWYIFSVKTVKGRFMKLVLFKSKMLVSQNPFCLPFLMKPFVFYQYKKTINVLYTVILYKHLIIYRKRVLICLHDNTSVWQKYNGITLWWNYVALVAISVVYFSVNFIWNTETVLQWRHLNAFFPTSFSKRC